MKYIFLKLLILFFLLTSVYANEQSDDYDTSKYTKVKLIDVVLETIAQSEILKSSRENVIRYEIKLKNAMADYYPTVNFEYVKGKTRGNPSGDDEKKFKFFNDEHYKFTLKQNIYSGLETNNMVKSVSKKLEVAKNQYKIKLDQEIKKAIKAYFDVVFANRSVMVNERNMKKLNKILEIVTIKYDNGAASIGDLTSIKANVANAMTKLVKVKSSLIESLRYYEYIVGSRFEKTLPYEKNFDIKIDDFDKLYERLLEKNKNLINYYKSITAEKYKHKSVRGRFEPKVDFELSYKETMQAEDSLEHERDLQGKFRVSYNLFNGGRDKNSVLELNSAIRDLNYKLEEEKKKLKWNLSKLHTSISSVSQALESTIEEVVASRKMVSSYWEAFKLGEQDLPALLQGQKQLNAAETEVVNFEKNQINDFFAILELTGDLSAFFDVDPENQKFIDFSKSDYKKTIVAKDGEKISLEVNDKNETAIEENKEKLEEVSIEQVKQIVVPQKSIEEKIKEFLEEFSSFDEQSYMIQISSFANIYEAFVFMKRINIENNSFSFDVLDNLNVKNLIVHNNFQNEQLANEYIKTFKEENSIEKDIKPVKVIKIRQLYENYLNGLKITKPKPEIKIVEKIRQEKPKKVFVTNEEFKNRFFNVDENFYTINVSSFTTKKELEKFILKNNIYEKSFFFEYENNNIQLYKLVTGIYENYESIEIDINLLAINNKQIFPVVEKIETIKKQYEKNIHLNNKISKPKQYEIVPLSSYKKEKTEKIKKKKEAIDIAKFEAERKAKLEADQKEIERKAKLEAERKELERKAKLEAEQKEIERKAKLEAERKAKLEAERKAKLEAERKAKLEAERKAKLEAEQKEIERKAKLEAERKAKLEIKSNIENKEPIKEIDFSNKKQENKKVISYKDRMNIFLEKFNKANRNRYTLHIATIKPQELSWYRSRFALQPKHITKTSNNKLQIYYGVFNTKEEALEEVKYLHPLIYESNPTVKLVGNVR